MSLEEEKSGESASEAGMYQSECCISTNADSEALTEADVCVLCLQLLTLGLMVKQGTRTALYVQAWTRVSVQCNPGSKLDLLHVCLLVICYSCYSYTT